MTNIFRTLRTRFLSGSQTSQEPGYFEHSLTESRPFKNNTFEMLLATSIGLFVLLAFWSILPAYLIGCVICGIIPVVMGWFDTIKDHKRIQALFVNNKSGEDISRESLNLASASANAGLWRTNTVALFLFLTLALLLGHYEKRPWQMRVKQYLIHNWHVNFDGAQAPPSSQPPP
jgi:hypothetical protein